MPANRAVAYGEPTSTMFVIEVTEVADGSHAVVGEKLVLADCPD